MRQEKEFRLEYKCSTHDWRLSRQGTAEFIYEAVCDFINANDHLKVVDLGSFVCICDDDDPCDDCRDPLAEGVVFKCHSQGVRQLMDPGLSFETLMQESIDFYNEYTDATKALRVAEVVSHK